MRIAEIMKSPVVVTQKNRAITHVRGLLERKDINAVPVLEMDGEIRGIITSNDIAKVHDDTKPVEEFMTKKVHVALKETSAKDAARMMMKHHCHHIVVMEDGQVIGMVSSMDIVKLFAEQ
ncbi:MAG: CBS domain-containing protein [Bacteroidia bacterium]|nr:CBS domain-containing protein [Bacteroidia bacterium]NNC85057.1 CBS domain-containing protein [Bacteroidia bacterium]NNM16709.1 CBS domain-containing protein [Bacteroidia bacterium]